MSSQLDYSKIKNLAKLYFNASPKLRDFAANELELIVQGSREILEIAREQILDSESSANYLIKEFDELRSKSSVLKKEHYNIILSVPNKYLSKEQQKIKKILLELKDTQE